MSIRSNSIVIATILVLFFATSFSRTANATVVIVETVVGDFEINLYDNTTPATVANFLDYVENGAYTDSIFHRSVSNFIVQSGGFQTDLNAQITSIPTNPAVTNEPIYSNVRGTIAMAKQGGNENSATSQWFINLSNNAGNLDSQNGGFTAFGEVTGNGMDVVDALAALPKFGFAPPLDELPLRNFTATDFANQVPINNSHLNIVTGISVIDSTVDSAAGLNPTPTTATPTVPVPNTGGGGGGGGGGSTGIFTLLGLIWLTRKRFFAAGSIALSRFMP